MKLFLTILSIIISMSAIKAQEPIVITGKCGRLQSFPKQSASELFIQEQASIAFPIWTECSVYFLQLDKESAQRIRQQTIGVVFVNNVGLIRPPLYGDSLLMLEVFPFRNNIYYCKSYAHQDVSKQRSMKMYDNIEQNIKQFLTHPEQCDTLKQPTNCVDSRYTPLLIKNLSNNKLIYIQYTVHGDGERVKRTKILGIVVKKEKKRVGYSKTYYESIRMSDFVRIRLEKIFRPIYWSFDIPDRNASTEEWQKWFDELLMNKNASR